MKRFLTALLLFPAFSIFGQAFFDLKLSNEIILTSNGDSIYNAFAGGMNLPRFQTIDLNNDGTEDLVIFAAEISDKGRIMTFIKKQVNGIWRYEYQPAYAKYFPKCTYWIFLVDYNCDGKKDLFTAVEQSAMTIYVNVSNSDTVKFAPAIPGNGILQATYNSGISNLYIGKEVDIPAILDVDGDGDIDILSFGASSTRVNFYENTSTDHCGITYINTETCWGDFEENALSNNLNLDACYGYRVEPIEELPVEDQTEKTQHSGSSVHISDLDGDGSLDIILGDISYNSVVAGFNAGTPSQANIESVDTNWPSSNIPVDIEQFPMCARMDLTHDGVSDIIFSPMNFEFENINNTWLYKNTGSASSPNWQRISTNFMYDKMLDLGQNAIPILADLNTDGLEDLIVMSEGIYVSTGNVVPQVKYFVRQPSTSSHPNRPIFTEVTGGLPGVDLSNSIDNPAPAFCDLDGDGDQDLIIGHVDGTLTLYTNNGTLFQPSFTLTTNNWMSIDAGSYAVPEFFDIDQDGDFDLFIGNQYGRVQLYLNDAGTFNLFSESYGDILADSQSKGYAYAVPRFFRRNFIPYLAVGSRKSGIAIFDSVYNSFTQAQSTDVQIGSGTTVTANGLESLFGTNYKAGKNQVLFTAQELKAQGMLAGNISAVSFEVFNTGSGNMQQGFTISFGTTTADSLTGFETGLTPSFYNLYGFGTGWNLISLTNPFYWDGESNIVMQICFSKGYTGSTMELYTTPTSFKSNAWGDSPNNNLNTTDGCTIPYLESSNNRPNIRFKITPAAIKNSTMNHFGANVAPVFFEVNNDGFPDCIVGNFSGGLNFYQGTLPDTSSISVPEELAQTTFNVYPNPNNGTFKISLSLEGQYPYQIIDLNGRMIQKGNLSSEEEIHVNQITPGIYFIQIGVGKEILTEKLLIY